MKPDLLFWWRDDPKIDIVGFFVTQGLKSNYNTRANIQSGLFLNAKETGAYHILIYDNIAFFFAGMLPLASKGMANPCLEARDSKS